MRVKYYNEIPLNALETYHKAEPHAAMLHTHDVTFQSTCDTAKSPAMACDAFSNMLVIWLPILEYLSYLLSDLQTVFSKMMSFQGSFM